MNYKCIELEGAIYQPKDLLQFKDYWIIPACNKSAALSMKDCKLVFVAEEKTKNIETSIYFFVLCYQFLFLKSDIYHSYDTEPNPKEFIENGQNINEIEQKIRIRYGSEVGSLVIDFNQIDSFHTGLPHPVKFRSIYDHFVEECEKDEDFRNIITLLLYTVGTKHKMYRNIFQKISQLQTIYETILGEPKRERCVGCGIDRYIETWQNFQKRRLKEKGIEDEKDIDLIIKIKDTLNHVARVKYIHRSQGLDTWRKLLQEISNGTHFHSNSPYKTNLEDILSVDYDKWAAIDWDNIYIFYQYIVKLLIYLEYFKHNQDPTV